MGFSKGSRGPTEKAAPARKTNRKPKGFDARGPHPMTRGTGNKKMSRVLKGADRKKQAKGKVVSDKHTKLDGKFF